MKTKTSKSKNQSKPTIRLKELKAKKDAKGGARPNLGGVNVVFGDGSVRVF